MDLEQEISDGSKDPLLGDAARKTVVSAHGSLMPFLDNMHHATHWLSAHEMERSKQPLGKRLSAIKTGHYLPLLAEVSKLAIVDDEDHDEEEHSYDQMDASDQSHMVQSEEQRRSHRASIKPIRKQQPDWLSQIKLGYFWAELDGYSVRVPSLDQFLPEGFVIPKCQCGSECNMVRFDGQDNVFYYMWVCSSRACMAWILYSCMDSFGNPIPSPYESGDKAKNENENGVQVHALSDRHFSSDDEITLEEFWGCVSKSGVPLDEATAKFICYQLPQRTCDCNFACDLVFCSASGAVFAVCPEQKCFALYTLVARTALLQLDVGQLVPFGCKSIDRYTTFTHAMAWFGRTFTKKYMQGLMKRSPDADFPTGSYRMQFRDGTQRADGGGDALKTEVNFSDVPEYDYFLSYRGAAGARWIWLTLCGHLNVLPAFTFLFGLCPLLVLGLHFVRDPCKNGSGFFVGCDDGDWYYRVFSIWGKAVTLVITLLWNPLCSWIDIPFLMPKKKIFLDKYCVHQSNSEKTGAGIMRLALNLRNTKELVCLFDDVYCTRLWCVWELATFLRLREKPKVAFVSMSLRTCGVLLVVFYMAQTLIMSLTAQSAPKDEIESWHGTIALSTIFIGSIILASVGFIFGQRHFRNDAKLRSMIESYDIRTAQCSTEGDADILLRFVNDLFCETDRSASNRPQGRRLSNENVESGLDTFNHFVRTQVPQHGVATSGIKKFKILSYVVAVLAPLQFYGMADGTLHSIEGLYDHWAFNYDPPPPLEESSADTQMIDGNPIHAFAISRHSRHSMDVSHPQVFETSAQSRHSPHPVLALSSPPVFADSPHSPHPVFDDSMMPPQMNGWMHGTGNSFRYALAVAFDKLIMLPFGAFLFGVVVRVFLWMQDQVTKYTGLKYWITVVLFLPPFLVLECVCCFRPQFVNFIRSVTSAGCIQGPSLRKYVGYSSAGESAYGMSFSFVRGIYRLLEVIHAEDINDAQSKGEEYYAADFHIYIIQPVTVTIDVLCWIFLVLPIFCFTFYIYEPAWFRTWRLKQWSRFTIK